MISNPYQRERIHKTEAEQVQAEPIRARGQSILYILDIFDRNDTNQPFYRVFNLPGIRNVGVLRRAG